MMVTATAAAFLRLAPPDMQQPDNSLSFMCLLLTVAAIVVDPSGADIPSILAALRAAVAVLRWRRNPSEAALEDECESGSEFSLVRFAGRVSRPAGHKEEKLYTLCSLRRSLFKTLKKNGAPILKKLISENASHGSSASAKFPTDSTPQLQQRRKSDMAPLMDTIALKYENPLVAVLSAATAAVAPMPRSPTAWATTAPHPFKKTHGHFTVQDLPAVVVQLICAFVDHKTLHAVEKTSGELYEIVQQSDLWKQMAVRDMVCMETRSSDFSWKRMTCLANRRNQEDVRLMHNVRGYSSADRPSETPINTLSHSKCWSEIRLHLENSALQNPHELHDVAAFGMSLGERIQLKCGCSTGNSCYWSSSASSDKHATDYIDYNLNEPCVVSCVQILPYRVFWHPGSPTYAPEKVYFEFYDASALQPVANQDYDVMADDIGAPFYQSPLYDVQNDMRLQDFVLPRKVVTSNSTVLRVKLVGRHQAQTFELPPWLQRTPEDRLPKYYCCISYVNVLGLHCVPSARGSNEIAPIKEQSIRMANSLVEYVTSCYEGVMGDMRRRGQ